MVKSSVNFDVAYTMDSGQTPTFTWRKNGNEYTELSTNHTLTVSLREVEHPAEMQGKLRKMFKLQDDVPRIYEKISEDDEVLREAIAKYGGLRLTHCDEWESTVAFILSQNNHIKRIQKNYFDIHTTCGAITPENLLKTDISNLKLGYREKYLKGTAAMIVENGFDLTRINKFRLDDAREALQELPGVGPKVADCILLYGYGRTECFPTDTWIYQAMEKYYDVRPKDVQQFAREKWGANAGYAQQLLFCKARSEL